MQIPTKLAHSITQLLKSQPQLQATCGLSAVLLSIHGVLHARLNEHAHSV